jgi:hypothetical protein
MTAPLVDCLDEPACDAIYKRGRIEEVRRLVIDESRLPPELQLFRSTSYPRDLLLRASFADHLGAAGFESFNLRPTRR